MNAVNVPLVLPWIAFAAVWATLAIAACALHRLSGSRLRSFDPEQRGALLLALALVPLVGAFGAVVLGFAPAVGGFVVDAHCHPDVGCTTHVPTLRADASLAVLLVFGIAASSAVIARSAAHGLRRSVRLSRALERLLPGKGRTHVGHRVDAPVEIIDGDERFAYCTGLIKPRVVVSRGLLDALPPLERQVVLAHERAHAVRHDNLRGLAAGIALWPAPRRIKHGLLRDLARAAELACDRRAAERVGGPAAVVAALEAAHASPGPPPFSLRHCVSVGRASASFRTDASAETLRERIAALRAAPDRRVPGLLAAAVIAIVYTGVTLAATLAAHHGVELLLARIG